MDRLTWAYRVIENLMSKYGFCDGANLPPLSVGRVMRDILAEEFRKAGIDVSTGDPDTFITSHNQLRVTLIDPSASELAVTEAIKKAARKIGSRKIFREATMVTIRMWNV